MNFFYARNLVSQQLFKGDPAAFVVTESITDAIKFEKEKRQAWYMNPLTQHCFYTLIEPLNPNLRCSKENNPPHAIWGFIADYDTLKLPKERILEAIERMPIKPARLEKSLGGNWRLVWLFSEPIKPGSYEFALFLHQQAVDWLNLKALPALDEPAFTTLTRLYCTGTEWEETGHGPVPGASVLAFLMKCSQKFEFRASTTDNDIPLDVVEKALKAKYPHFNWPGPFVEGSQGPSFWIPESTSPMSAVIKKGGILTFSAHATKMFYTWSDLLGSDFSSKWSEEAIYAAVKNVYWDGKMVWRILNGIYQSEDRSITMHWLRVDCRLSDQKDKKTRVSQLDLAWSYISNKNRISGACPHIFRPSGLFTYMGQPRLNTYTAQPIIPATGAQKWGPEGNAPWLCAFWDHLLNREEDEKQFWHYIAWAKLFVTCAVNWVQRPGTIVFMGGVHSGGKTFNGKEVIGPMVGGFADASEFIVKEIVFNSHLTGSPHWMIDDDAPTGSPAAIRRATRTYKKLAANQAMSHNAKFEKSVTVEYYGRTTCTFNLDPHSIAVLGDGDEATVSKFNIIQCNSVKFPGFSADWAETQRRRDVELPFFARILLDIGIPDFVEQDKRYGYAGYRQSSVLDQAIQGQNIAPFKELLIETLNLKFQDVPDPVWECTTTALIRAITANSANEGMMRSMRPEVVNGYMEQIAKSKVIKIDFFTGKHGIRLMRFYRTDFIDEVAPATQPPSPTPTGPNPFEKHD
jgi:hypothetical protein